MSEPEDHKTSQRTSRFLPILVLLQFVLTIATLGFVAYLRFSQPAVEYPVIVVQSPSEDAYTEKFKGKVTVFDLPDISEWQRFDSAEATDSSSLNISFLHPPNFTISADSDGQIHLSQNRKDFLIIASSDTDDSDLFLRENRKIIQFGKEKQFYHYEDESIGRADENEIEESPILYYGFVNSQSAMVVDTRLFSPEVVYLILMSMEEGS